MPFAYAEQAHAIDPHVVAALWSVTASEPTTGVGPILAPYCVLPDGCLDLVLRTHPDEPGSLAEPEILIVGQARAPALVEVAPGTLFYGVRFQPGRGGAALGFAACDLTDRTLLCADAESVLGPLAERLRGARTPVALRESLAALATVLAARAEERAGPAPARAAVALIRRHRGRVAVGPLASRLGVSERTLHRMVTEASGLSPRALASVLRFQHALALVRQGVPLAGAAVRAGYSDQAHMTRAFQHLGGFTPGSAPRVGEG